VCPCVCSCVCVRVSECVSVCVCPCVCRVCVRRASYSERQRVGGVAQSRQQQQQHRQHQQQHQHRQQQQHRQHQQRLQQQVARLWTRMKRGSYSSCSEDSDYKPGGKRQWRKIGRPGRPSLPTVTKPHGQPDEIFRTDLISAMKLPDSGSLVPGQFYLLADPWRPEWERGVQVPVCPESIPVPSFRILNQGWCSDRWEEPPPHRLLPDPDPDPDDVLRTPPATRDHDRGEEATQYDLDDVDVSWLRAANGEMTKMGLPPVRERSLEAALSRLERRCADSALRALSTEAALGIEFDADVVCDVCRSPHAEDGNEMVFCDKCDVCVHQACYGIACVPAGSWLCRVCDRGVAAPRCQLCPRRDGAMKPTRSGGKWAHVSCALWIPEVSIGCPEKMEPITRLSLIPPTRWALLCCLCHERTGACIQCSEHTCVRAFHVTCGFHGGLDMATFLDERTDRVRFRSYCPEHTQRQQRLQQQQHPQPPSRSPSQASHIGNRGCSLPPSPEFPPDGAGVATTPTGSTDWDWEELPGGRRAAATGVAAARRAGGGDDDDGGDGGIADAVAEMRRERLRRLEEEFYTLAGAADAAPALGRAGSASAAAADLVYQFWKLRRKSGFDRPLLTTPSVPKPAAVPEPHRPPTLSAKSPPPSPSSSSSSSSPAHADDDADEVEGHSEEDGEDEDDEDDEEEAEEEERHAEVAVVTTATTGEEEESAAQRDMNSLTHLRQNLERARNLCYMVSRREKLKSALARLHEQLFWRRVQLALASPPAADAAADDSGGLCARPSLAGTARKPRGAPRHRKSRDSSSSSDGGSSGAGDGGSSSGSSADGRPGAPRRRKRRRRRQHARSSASVGRRRGPGTGATDTASAGPRRRGRRSKSAAGATAGASTAAAAATAAPAAVAAAASKRSGAQAVGATKIRVARSAPAGPSTNWGGFRIPKKPGGAGGGGGVGAGTSAGEVAFPDLEEDVAGRDCDLEAADEAAGDAAGVEAGGGPLARGSLWSLASAAPGREMWPFGRFRADSGDPVKAGVSIIC
ncbi:protein Jade-1-like, partial [Lethenteron reissneri]|uniref:protein Jade-1-like n=1 Tax=Lethenteron reissneri TaxID=7753 RepID=UPI002AB69DF7